MPNTTPSLQSKISIFKMIHCRNAFWLLKWPIATSQRRLKMQKKSFLGATIGGYEILSFRSCKTHLHTKEPD